jgi:two-component system sensor histidine kinase BarA
LITYRSFKKLLGETSLERKCRFLFGGGLMLLITGSFWFYAHRTAQIVNAQNEQTARTLVRKVLQIEHRKSILDKAAKVFSEDEQSDPHGAALKTWLDNYDDEVGNAMDSLNELEAEDEYYWTLNGRDENPFGNYQEIAYRELQKRDTDEHSFNFLNENGDHEFCYTTRIRARKTCLSCHQQFQEVSLNDELGQLSIFIPTKTIDKSLGRNNAILLATAILTAFLAMLAAYAIVR